MVYVEDTTPVYVSDRLFENRNGKFFDVTKKAGLIDHAFGLSASIADVNGDGWPDIYTANDFNKPDFLYIDNRNGTFTNRLAESIRHTSFSAMGSDISDIKNDGHEDIYVVDMAVENPVRQKQLFAVNQNYDKFHLMVKYGLYYQYPRNTLQLNNAGGVAGHPSYPPAARSGRDTAPESAGVNVLAQREAENEKHDQQLASLRKQLKRALEDAFQLVELGGVLAKSAKIEAAYGQTFAVPLAQVSGEFDGIVEEIRSSLESLRRSAFLSAH